MKKSICKRVLCGFLVCVLLFLPAAAVQAETACEHTPIVMVQGFAGPRLLRDAGEETEEQVWGILDALLATVLRQLPQTLFEVGASILGNPQLLADHLGGLLVDLIEPVSCNPDGTSVYNITPYPQGAEKTNMANMLANGDDGYIAEPPIAQEYANVVGEDHLYIFIWDWRMGQVEAAAALDKYIQEVKAYSGHDKVNLFALSHGGQLAATYLYYFADKMDVDRATLAVPAIGGTAMVTDLFDAEFALDVVSLLEYAEIGSRTEQEFEWLLENIEFKNLTRAVEILLADYLIPSLKYFGCVWDLLPVESYEANKAKHLDPVESARLIALSDEMHYTVMPNVGKALRDARKNGIAVSIFCNTGRRLLTSSVASGDYLLDVTSVSGSDCAPLGEQFARGYQQQNTTCTDASHYHIAPGNNIDASTGYLPDYTWYIQGQYHGQGNWDTYSQSLYLALMFGDKDRSVFSDDAYPQFETGQNPADALHVKFSDTVTGYIQSENETLTIRSLSEQYDTTILSVKVDGADIEVVLPKNTRIAAGESVELEIQGTLAGASTFAVTIEYHLHTFSRPVSQKTADFTVVNKAMAAMQPFAKAVEAEPTVPQEKPEQPTSATPTNPEKQPEAEAIPQQEDIPQTGDSKSAVWAIPVLLGACTALVVLVGRGRKKLFQ